jgi:hypothetical protein
MIKKARRDPVVVPDTDDMDDETFYKHFNLRHLNDIGLLTPIEYSPLFMPGLVNAMREFHIRCHEISRPGQYKHEHEEV